MNTLTLSHALAGFALFNGVAQGFNVYVYNKCGEDCTLAHVTQGAVDTVQVAAGTSTIRNIPSGSPSHVLKWGVGAQATLAEFSAEMNMAWYDISAIPTGPKSGPADCSSWSACKDLTGGVGFNKPMQITPHGQDGQRCVELTCLQDDCNDAYLYPKDDTKTHTCPLSTDFDVTFCPGGSGGAAPAPPAPTPAPAPEPTAAPTPTPPVEQQEPEPQQQEQQPQQQEEEPQAQIQPNATAAPTESSSGPSGTLPNAKTASNTPSQAGTIRKGNTPSASKSPTPETTPTTPDTTQMIGEGTTDETVQHINTQSESSGTNSTPYIVLGVGGFVGIAAAAAIFAVRKKKAALDDLESKTPVSGRPLSTLAGFRTPRDNVSVL